MLTKGMTMVIWVVAALNQLFIRIFYTQIQLAKKKVDSEKAKLSFL